MLKNQLVEIQRKISEINDNCHHTIIEVGAQPEYGWHGDATCEDCDTHFGWWCPVSPDHTCYYHTEEIGKERGVTLHNGQNHIFQEYDLADVEYETEDNCLFCHDPDERK